MNVSVCSAVTDVVDRLLSQKTVQKTTSNAHFTHILYRNISHNLSDLKNEKYIFILWDTNRIYVAIFNIHLLFPFYLFSGV